MTEFGRTPFFTASEFADMGYKMVIWPASSLRVAAKAQEELFAAIRRDGGTQSMLPRMQTRNELYATDRLSRLRGAGCLHHQDGHPGRFAMTANIIPDAEPWVVAKAKGTIAVMTQ